MYNTHLYGEIWKSTILLYKIFADTKSEKNCIEKMHIVVKIGLDIII